MAGTTKHVGEELDPLDTHCSDGRVRKMGPVGQRIFDALCSNPYGLTSRQLVDIVYRDDPDGGPLSDRNAIDVRIVHMNRMWRRRGVGLRIRSRGHWGYQVWITR